MRNRWEWIKNSYNWSSSSKKVNALWFHNESKIFNNFLIFSLENKSKEKV